MQRVIIVGDVHGMYDELVSLLALVDFRPDDQLVMLGDLIDKGPDSVGVVSMLRAMRERGHDIVLLMGNHEEKLLRFYEKRSDPVAARAMPAHASHRTMIDALGESNMAFLGTALLWYDAPHANALAVHAGIPPVITSLPSYEEYATLTPKQKRHLLQMLRVRAVDSSGNAIPLDKWKPEDAFWAESYDGRFGHVYFGHFAFQEDSVPRQFPHATGLDLGAVYGNRLAAAVLERGRDTELVSVPAMHAFS